VSWGGAYTKSQVEAYHKPWMAAETAKQSFPKIMEEALPKIKAQVDLET
jgi:putative spermidine/putrescine transport system substrate-binding protein